MKRRRLPTDKHSNSYFSADRLWRAVHTALPLVLTILIFCACAGIAAQSTLQGTAADKKVFIGNIISNGHLDDPANFRNGQADTYLRTEHNAVSLENYMKMAFVLPASLPDNIHDLSVSELRGLLNENKITTFINDPNWAGLRKRGHAMIWFNQAPAWLNLVGPTWTGQQVFSFSRKYILALGQICGNSIAEWDVINEAIADQAPNGQRIWRQGTWYRRANDGSMTDWGEATYENYIKMLFVWGREAQPQARLHINDYGIEFFDTSPASKNRFMRDQVKALKDCGAPIDGVGFQSHFTLSDMVSVTGDVNTAFIRSVEQSMQDLATKGLEVAITELDIRICNQDRDESLQEAAFRAFCEMAYAQPNCQEIVIWGLRDEDNWITLRNDSFFAGCEDAVITEGDNYTRKAAYNGVATALAGLPNRSDFSFAPLNQGDGSSADCGGSGAIISDVLQIAGPRAVSPGEQVTVQVNYLASVAQDVVVWFQLDADPFTVFSQVVQDVPAGSGTVDITITVPGNVDAGTGEYRYLAFITPDGAGYPERINERIQNQITVLSNDSQVVISCSGPEQVMPGQTVNVNVDYSAVAGQEIVVWFQQDQQPFTTYQEVRQTAITGRNQLVVELLIPTDVPIATDAYQYQTLLVPTGGGWPERISNISQTNVDVVMMTSNEETYTGTLPLRAYPNPTVGTVKVELPFSAGSSELTMANYAGQVVYRQQIRAGVREVGLDLSDFARGLYWLSLRQDQHQQVTKLVKQ